MPLFNYQCNKCESITEKFQHKVSDKPELICVKCGGLEFKRLFSSHHNRTTLNSKETYTQKIKPDVDRIGKEINKGKDKAFLDIYGEK